MVKMKLSTLALALALASGLTAVGEARNKPPVHKVKGRKMKPHTKAPKYKRPKVKHN